VLKATILKEVFSLVTHSIAIETSPERAIADPYEYQTLTLKSHAKHKAIGVVSPVACRCQLAQQPPNSKSHAVDYHVYLL
jgi:hypothetical protein